MDREERGQVPAVPEQHNQGGEQVDVVIAHGRKIVSDEIRALTEEKVGRLGRRCPGLDRAEVHFSEERNPRISDRECCEVIMVPRPRPGRGSLLRGAQPEDLRPRVL